MTYPNRKGLIRFSVLIGVLLLTTITLTACDLNYYQLGKASGHVGREVADRLKLFIEGFTSGFGGQFCATTALPGVAISLVVGVRRHHRP